MIAEIIRTIFMVLSKKNTRRIIELSVLYRSMETVLSKE